MRILKTLNLIIIGRIGPESLDLTDIKVPETATIVQMGYNQLYATISANQIRSMWVGVNFAYRTDSESFKNQIHLNIELLFPYQFPEVVFISTKYEEQRIQIVLWEDSSSGNVYTIVNCLPTLMKLSSYSYMAGHFLRDWLERHQPPC